MIIICMVIGMKLKIRREIRKRKPGKIPLNMVRTKGSLTSSGTMW